MSQEVFLRGVLFGFLSLMLSWVVFSQYDEEVGSEKTGVDRQRYLPGIPGSLLPLFLLTITALTAISYGVFQAAALTLSMCFGIFLHISIYYLVVLLVLPFFRKHISARACAMLWVIPNYLYITTQSSMKLPNPRFVLYAPGNLVWVLFGIWLAGFVGVLGWNTLRHLLFRRHILRHAVPVTDAQQLSVWNQTIEDARLKRFKGKLVISPNVSTPISVGMFRRAVRVVLPERPYTAEELGLVLKHEIVHISREDAWSKYFLIFCTAMCWFNPLMWVAARRSAEDLELSCDETVLLDCGPDVRKQYASLLLQTAGDGRGFTTCLSTSAESLRYRLRRIVRPARRRCGALVIGAVFFILCMTSGYVALAYGGISGAEAIYAGGNVSAYTLRHVTLIEDGEYHTDFEVADQRAFHEYLAGLTLSELTGNYSFSQSSRDYIYIMDTPSGALGVELTDHAIKLVPLAEDKRAKSYYLVNSVDWDYLSTIVVEHSD